MKRAIKFTPTFMIRIDTDWYEDKELSTAEDIVQTEIDNDPAEFLSQATLVTWEAEFIPIRDN